MILRKLLNLMPSTNPSERFPILSGNEGLLRPMIVRGREMKLRYRVCHGACHRCGWSDQLLKVGRNHHGPRLFMRQFAWLCQECFAELDPGQAMNSETADRPKRITGAHGSKSGRTAA
jgi:hypothetical protein